jgi:hypothetical protein
MWHEENPADRDPQISEYKCMGNLVPHICVSLLSFNLPMFTSSFGHHVQRQMLVTFAGDLNYTHRNDPTFHHYLLIETPSDLMPNVTYMVKVLVVDNRGCEGTASNYTFTCELIFF